jgi:peptide/nickel transport system ATP-binding protein
MTAVLEIDALSVGLAQGAGMQVVDAVSLRIDAGETLCLVGESGSGKTVTALAVTRLIDFKGGRITGGAVRLAGANLAGLSQREMNQLRGRRIGFVFQEPMTAFDPLFSIGQQIIEVLRRHQGLGRAAGRAQAIALLRRVQIPDPELRVDQHPHELSGGLRQRAMIAMALACDPVLLIADEPTTALDVTVQAQILELLRALQATNGMAILLITHDLGVAAQMADRVAVMYAGRIVENARAERIFSRPAHPYTRALLSSLVGAHLPAGARLPAIGGAIPSLAEPPGGCRFHPRCSRADATCASDAPPLLGDDRTGLVACWHPHTAALPARAASAPAETDSTPGPALLEAHDLHKHYKIGFGWTGRRLRAVDGVSLSIAGGETFGLVGESGCGKSSLGRLLLRLEPPTAGHVRFDGQDLAGLGARALRRVRRDMQMVFQDPHGSVDPRSSVEDIIAEPLVVHASLSRAERRDRVAELLRQVGLDPALHTRYPHQLSGGQRQRVAIARAIAPRPRFVLLDEAVSALDVSVQAQVINLLQDLRAELGLTYLFIGHGLHLVRHVSHRVGVMYLGRLVETGPAEAVFRTPTHPYTRALIDAIPQPDPALRGAVAPIAGDLPSPAGVPSGCRFHPRCPMATRLCRDEDPALARSSDGREIACHHPL